MLIADCNLEAVESNSIVDQQKAVLKSKVQSVFCYLKEGLFRKCDAPTHYSKHFHAHSNVIVANIMANLSRKTKSCSYKLSKGPRNKLLASKIKMFPQTLWMARVEEHRM